MTEKTVEATWSLVWQYTKEVAADREAEETSPGFRSEFWPRIDREMTEFYEFLTSVQTGSDTKDDVQALGEAWVFSKTHIPAFMLDRAAGDDADSIMEYVKVAERLYGSNLEKSSEHLIGCWSPAFIEGVMSSRGEPARQRRRRHARADAVATNARSKAMRGESLDDTENPWEGFFDDAPFHVIGGWGKLATAPFHVMLDAGFIRRDLLHNHLQTIWTSGFITGWHFDEPVRSNEETSA